MTSGRPKTRKERGSNLHHRLLSKTNNKMAPLDGSQNYRFYYLSNRAKRNLTERKRKDCHHLAKMHNPSLSLRYEVCLLPQSSMHRMNPPGPQTFRPPYCILFLYYFYLPWQTIIYLKFSAMKYYISCFSYLNIYQNNWFI